MNKAKEKAKIKNIKDRVVQFLNNVNKSMNLNNLNLESIPDEILE
jgi:hypothetical protein